MITIIPENQKCQVFDSIMMLPEKTKYIIDNHMNANTSCFAPAYVYLEGSRGKRFLCDYHYIMEKDAVMCRTPNLWPDIEQHIINDMERIKDTFPKQQTDEISSDTVCWCGKRAYVITIPKKNKHHIIPFCNFHYRKTYFRYLSNNINFFELFIVIDERYKMKESINEEAASLTII